MKHSRKGNLPLKADDGPVARPGLLISLLLDGLIQSNTHHDKSQCAIDTSDHSQIGKKYVHKVKILKDSLLYKIIGKEEIKVNSRHNYHVPEKLDYLKSAYATDGIIEAVESKDNKFTLGVQWHPETMISYDEDAKKIIQAFIDKCKN